MSMNESSTEPLLGPVAGIRVFCRDLGAAQAFYSDQLGLREMSTTASWLVYDIGEADLIVEVGEDQDTMGAEPTTGRFTGFSFRVDDLAAVCEALDSRGVEIVGPPARQPWGGALAHIADPSGNVLTLVEYPRPD